MGRILSAVWDYWNSVDWPQMEGITLAAVLIVGWCAILVGIYVCSFVSSVLHPKPVANPYYYSAAAPHHFGKPRQVDNGNLFSAGQAQAYTY